MADSSHQELTSPTTPCCFPPLLQLLFDAGAAYSIFMSAGFLALGGDFFGRVPLVFLLDFLAIYFAFGVLFDLVTLTSVLITTARLGTTPLAFYDGEIAANACVRAWERGKRRLGTLGFTAGLPGAQRAISAWMGMAERLSCLPPGGHCPGRQQCVWLLSSIA